MLIFSRKPGEKLLIGSNITVTVLEVRGQRVKISIDGPDSMQVVRGELIGWLDLSTLSEQEFHSTWTPEEEIEPSLVLSR